MPAMYILKCGDGSFYVGSCWDLPTRVDQHMSGMGGAYTSKRQPVVLVYAEEFDRRDDACEREKQIQDWGGKKRIALIEGRMGDLPDLSRSVSADNGQRGGPRAWS